MQRVFGRHFFCAFLLFCSSCTWASEIVPGEFLIQFKKNIRFTSAESILQKISTEPFELVSKSAGVYLIKRPSVESVEGSLSILSKIKSIQAVEANHRWHLRRIPQDPMFKELWGLMNFGQESHGESPSKLGVSGVDINMSKAWDITTGDKKVKVAVIDTGIDYNHPDLKENIWINEAELNGQPGVDDDNNGCIDDIHGCNFAYKNGYPMDDDGHGSHVAGTIGAVGNNNIGVTGINWSVSLVPVKFIDNKDEGTTDDAIRCIDYAIAVGAKVISNSWGGDDDSAFLKQAIERSRDAGALFVVASGNDAKDGDLNPDFPAGFDIENIISVAAIDNTGELADFSNYGKIKVHIAAPGENILSTYSDPKYPGLNYDGESGTSMATPHVSGVAALLLAKNPTITYKEMKKAILDSARPLPALKGKVSTDGMLDAYEALKLIQ